MFASQYYQAAPDITCCGKGMSGGYAPSRGHSDSRPHRSRLLWRRAGQRAVSSRPHLWGQSDRLRRRPGGPERVSGTGYPRATSVCRASDCASAWTSLAERFAIIGEVRGVGLLQGFEFVSDRLTKQRFEGHVRPGKLLEQAARARGLLLRCGSGIRRFCSASHRDWRGHRRDDPSAWRKPRRDRSEIDVASRRAGAIPKDRTQGWEIA